VPPWMGPLGSGLAVEVTVGWLSSLMREHAWHSDALSGTTAAGGVRLMPFGSATLLGNGTSAHFELCGGGGGGGGGAATATGGGGGGCGAMATGGGAGGAEVGAAGGGGGKFCRRMVELSSAVCCAR
jgi:hypothetical protein